MGFSSNASFIECIEWYYDAWAAMPGRLERVSGLVDLLRIFYAALFVVAVDACGARCVHDGLREQSGLASLRSVRSFQDICGRDGADRDVSGYAIAVKNMKTECEGLSLALFLFAIAGNVTYVLSICSESVSSKHLVANASWLVGSGGTVVLDLIVSKAHYLFFKQTADIT